VPGKSASRANLTIKLASWWVGRALYGEVDPREPRKPGEGGGGASGARLGMNRKT